MKRLSVCTLALLFFSVQPLLADATTPDPMERFKQYVNEMVTEVKETEDPAEKRALLDESLQKMEEAADRVRHMPGIDADDEEALAALSTDISEKRDQLNGHGGYERVADADLDRFADYVQQDLEQAQRLVISISSAALVLILVLLLLL